MSAITLLNDALVAKAGGDWRPEDFETALLQAADADRSGTTMAIVNTVIAEDRELHIVAAEDGFEEVDAETPYLARVMMGPNPVGGSHHTLTGAGVLIFQQHKGASNAKARKGMRFIDKESKFDYKNGPCNLYEHYYSSQAAMNHGKLANQ